MSDMKLYRWCSNTLASYTDGEIIVMAPNVRKARRMVRAMVREEYGNKPAGPEYLAEKLALFEADISYKPDALKGDAAVCFIWGSD